MAILLEIELIASIVSVNRFNCSRFLLLDNTPYDTMYNLINRYR